MTVKPSELKYREEMRASGLCVYYGCRTPSAPHRYCSTHRDYFKAKSRENFTKRRSAGLCTQCGHPSPKVRCDKCRPGKGA